MQCRFSPESEISIHSLRMEGDAMLLPIFGGAENISIHSLRMEGDVLDGRNKTIS